jgi:ribosomal protein S18 acetylase RimI-like enzyme
MTIGTAKLRLATASDVPNMHLGLASLAHDLGHAESFQGRCDSLLKYGFGETPQFHTAIVEWDQEFVGLAIFFPYYSTMRNRPGVYIQDLWVASNQRQHGLGKKLLSFVAQTSSVLWGAQFMKLVADSHNIAAQRLYLRIGFNTRSEDKNMVLDPQDFENLAEGAHDAQ